MLKGATIDFNFNVLVVVVLDKEEQLQVQLRKRVLACYQDKSSNLKGLSFTFSLGGGGNDPAAHLLTNQPWLLKVQSFLTYFLTDWLNPLLGSRRGTSYHEASAPRVHSAILSKPLVECSVPAVHGGDLAIAGKCPTCRVFRRSECVEVTRGKLLCDPVDILKFGWPLLSPHYVSLMFNMVLIKS